jgi:hypothetical protein
VPELPEVGLDWDVDDPGSRFARTPAIALAVPEQEWGIEGEALEEGAEQTFRNHLGDWALEEQDVLGQPEAVPGSAGRGAAGLAAVLEFVGMHAAGGAISAAAGIAFKRFVERAHEAVRGGDHPGVQVSRGGAAYLAVAEVAGGYGEQDVLEVEAVEEPSYIAGQPVSELSYVSIEPWLVLLRNREKLRRYVVVVSPGGEVLGSMVTAMGEWEDMFLPQPQETEWATPPRRRKKWWRR